jgi:hypothetical protein
MGSINAKMADQMTHALTIRNRLQDSVNKRNKKCQQNLATKGVSLPNC